MSHAVLPLHCCDGLAGCMLQADTQRPFSEAARPGVRGWEPGSSPGGHPHIVPAKSRWTEIVTVLLTSCSHTARIPSPLETKRNALCPAFDSVRHCQLICAISGINEGKKPLGYFSIFPDLSQHPSEEMHPMKNPMGPQTVATVESRSATSSDIPHLLTTNQYRG